MFTAVYINHPKLTQAQKLYHLRYKTTGKAGQIVKQYSLSDDNFLPAWAALKSRYENRRMLIENQLKVLLNLPPIRSENSEELQELQAKINTCLYNLDCQKVPVDNWDPIIVYVCAAALPRTTYSLWEQTIETSSEFPTWSQLDTFLTSRYKVVERINSRHTPNPTTQISSTANQTLLSTTSHPPTKQHNFTTDQKRSFSCKLCNAAHPLKACQKFKNLSIPDRIKFVKDNRICENCLALSHNRAQCTSTFRCTYCKQPHHSMLHLNENSRNSKFQKTVSQHAACCPTQISNSTHELSTPLEKPCCSKSTNIQMLHANECTTTLSSGQKVLLPTAQVMIEHEGEYFKLRALIDQGSQRSFVSASVQSRLQLPFEPSKFEISGMGGLVVQHSKKLCHMTIVTPNKDRKIKATAIVLPKLTKLLPTFPISNNIWSQFSTLQLADPNCHKPAQIDLVLGSDLIPQILLPGLKNICEGLLAQSTIFGWIISGPITEHVSAFNSCIDTVTNETLSSQLRQFKTVQEQEEVCLPTEASEEDHICEEKYKSTTTRSPCGRYTVRLPFKSSFPDSTALGHSRATSLQQFFSMERTLQKKGSLKTLYDDVLNEYLTLEHMENCPSKEIKVDDKCFSYYLPHHAVVKPEKVTSKVRVVFNASKTTTSGNSLNDVLYTGPTLQQDLMLLILKWRMYKVVFNGDIEKMYRQILVHKDDRDFQRIVFRSSPLEHIQDYRMKTVTFGVNCAPYLAIRTLQQLAYDEETQFPLATPILLNNTYVDDILAGGHDVKSAIESLTHVIQMLKSAGFPLKKITSNHPAV